MGITNKMKSENACTEVHNFKIILTDRKTFGNIVCLIVGS